MTLSMPAAPHQRFWANGRSMLTVRMTTSGPNFAASALNRRVSMSQVGVSSEGTAAMATTLPLN
jgi:hypothetical protein